MKQCAVVLNGNDVVKVSNLKRKYDKIMSNPNMKILEECDKEMLDEKYNYWNRTLNRNIEERAKNRTIEIARNMKLSGLDTNTIAKLTNLSRDEIDKL